MVALTLHQSSEVVVKDLSYVLYDSLNLKFHWFLVILNDDGLGGIVKSGKRGLKVFVGKELVNILSRYGHLYRKEYFMLIKLKTLN